MAKRNLENLYVPSHRTSNDRFREMYDKIKWEKDVRELRDDIRKESEKGKVTGHFA